ncbi:MAG: ABC transporter ATP-binding protein [Candidatus Aminicenantes bacterium]|jgi:ATP-binding cassette subfamily C protein
MLKNYIRELIGFARVKVIVSAVLFILLGLTQGVGLVMIIPFLHTLGLSGGDVKISGFSAVISRAFNTLGLPFNLYTMLGAYVVIVSIFAFLNRYQAILNVEIQQGFIRFLRDRMYRALTYADWLFIARKKSSDITHALTSDIMRIGGGTFFFLQFSSLLILVIFHIVVAVLLSLPLTLMTLVFGGIMFIFMRPLNREAFASGKSFRFSQQDLFSAVMEHLTGVKTAKSFGVETHHIGRIESINRELETEILRFTRARTNTRLFYEIMAVIFLSAFFIAAVNVFMVPTARLLLLVFIFTRLLPKFSTLQQQYQNIKNMLPAFSGTTELYKQARAAEESRIKTPVKPIRLEQAVSFRGVCFRYSPNSDQYALYNASFDIPAQKITAVMGPSGAGKSTLADLLLGLLKPEQGKILVDEREITDERLKGWRHSIGYVPQETFFFHDTIRANMLWANVSASEADLWQALRTAAAEDFVQQLPNGLDTVIGDRGVLLSGGERQRIALARALLRKPQLLLLDEATSAVDSQNEQRIQQAIRSLQGKLTVVIIAHRPSTLRWADHIIALEKGPHGMGDR